MLTLPRKLLNVTGLVVGSQVGIEVDKGRLVLLPLKPSIVWMICWPSAKTTPSI